MHSIRCEACNGSGRVAPGGLNAPTCPACNGLGTLDDGHGPDPVLDAVADAAGARVRAGVGRAVHEFDPLPRRGAPTPGVTPGWCKHHPLVPMLAGVCLSCLGGGFAIGVEGLRERLDAIEGRFANEIRRVDGLLDTFRR